MIELFTIFGKGGLVLWCLGGDGQEMFKEAVNELLSTVLLQQRALSSINHQGITLKYRLDNEFDLVLVVGSRRHPCCTSPQHCFTLFLSGCLPEHGANGLLGQAAQ